MVKGWVGEPRVSNVVLPRRTANAPETTSADRLFSTRATRVAAFELLVVRRTAPTGQRPFPPGVTAVVGSVRPSSVGLRKRVGTRTRRLKTEKSPSSRNRNRIRRSL